MYLGIDIRAISVAQHNTEDVVSNPKIILVIMRRNENNDMHFLARKVWYKQLVTNTDYHIPVQ